MINKAIKNHEARNHLPHRMIVGAAEHIDVAQAASHAVKRMHGVMETLSGSAASAKRYRVSERRFVLDAFNLRKEVNDDVTISKFTRNDGGVGGMVVAVRKLDVTAYETLRQP